MLNTGLVFIVGVALALSLVVGIYVLFQSQSSKKNYFLLMQFAVIVYLFGYLLELTSVNTGEAFTGVKVLYAGAYLVPVFALFFILDYCNIKVSAFLVKTPMIALSTLIILTMWTTGIHGLVYRAYSFDTTFTHHLAFTPGTLYSVIHLYPTACMIAVMAVILYQLRKWKNKYRGQLFFLFVCMAIPFAAESVYFITVYTGINKYHIYFTPHSMSIMSFCLYLGVIRYNIFEIISVAALTAMDHIREGFILVDENNFFLSSNSAAVRIFPGIAKLAKGEPVSSAEGWPGELKELEGESAAFSADNGTRHFEASISPVIAPKNAAASMAKIILLREITDSVNLMRELENAAYMDALTGLYNRKHFYELAKIDIERASRTNQSIFTGMLDLDFFKKVNDSYGHAAGDLVLKATAGIIHQTIRSYDLVGRFGGEEFVLLITGLEISEACKLMERIRENMEHRVTRYEGTEIIITCSIGLAEFREGDTLESSVKKADEALYTAKHSGRNRVCVFGSSEAPAGGDAPLPA